MTVDKDAQNYIERGSMNLLDELRIRIHRLRYLILDRGKLVPVCSRYDAYTL
jgi:hypothetical protein